QVIQAAGVFRLQTTCPSCRGTGTVIREKCPTCGGDGATEERVERSVVIPAGVDNDVRVAVIAEHGAGAGQGARNMVAVWPGTGVGGGIIINGKIYTGADSYAGEIGHITVKVGGAPCGCGGRGHLEAYCSRTAIVKR
ncbi:MAG: ROK family protein, partial [Betaproteobacteria bacterium]|nr:ROK family protein [Betaproteobacteria bacterium]